jgi:hypothetical protein
MINSFVSFISCIAIDDCGENGRSSTNKRKNRSIYNKQTNYHSPMHRTPFSCA